MLTDTLVATTCASDAPGAVQSTDGFGNVSWWRYVPSETSGTGSGEWWQPYPYTPIITFPYGYPVITTTTQPLFKGEKTLEEKSVSVLAVLLHWFTKLEDIGFVQGNGDQVKFIVHSDNTATLVLGPDADFNKIVDVLHKELATFRGRDI
jgi:hypothetical protein